MGGRRKEEGEGGGLRRRKVAVVEEGVGGAAMGGEGAVKLSTQFTQTALSARAEPLHCQTKEEEGEREPGPDREVEREEGREGDGQRS